MRLTNKSKEDTIALGENFLFKVRKCTFYN